MTYNDSRHTAIYVNFEGDTVEELIVVGRYIPKDRVYDYLKERYNVYKLNTINYYRVKHTDDTVVTQEGLTNET